MGCCFGEVRQLEQINDRQQCLEDKMLVHSGICALLGAWYRCPELFPGCMGLANIR